jgi:signal transduction histidine kinase
MLKHRKNRNEYAELREKIRHLEDNIRLSRKETEILRSVFLKHIPHEIRTPMNSIVGFSTLLAKSRLSDAEKMEYLHHINASSEELLMVLDNLVDMALLHSGQISLKPDDFSLHQLFLELHQKFKEYGQNLGRKNVRVTHTLAGPLQNAFVRTDRYRLKQVLIHLIQNAFKFTATGTIDFGCHPGNGSHLQFVVTDTGKGIPDTDTQHIFDSFRKQAGPPSEQNRGLGLGLSISRELVELLGGTLHYQPNQPHGSIFRFSLPLKTFQADEGIQVDRDGGQIQHHVKKSWNGLAI